MLYCQKCCVQIRGHKSCCPLCQGVLVGDVEPDVFPDMAPKRVSAAMLTRIGTFLFVSYLIILGAIFLISGFANAYIPVLALVGALVWLDFMVFMYYRNDILKAITIEVYLGMIICLVIDFVTGRPGWSMAYVLPAGFLFLVLSTILTGLGQRLYLSEYLVYLAVSILLSLLQIIPVLTGWNPRPVLAVSCMAFMLILTAGMLIFRFRDLKTALEKLFNM